MDSTQRCGRAARARAGLAGPRAGGPAQRLVDLERGLVWVRWFGVGFALLQIVASTWAAGRSSTPGYLLPAAFALVGALAACNLGLALWLRRGTARRLGALRAAGLVALGADHAFLIAMVWLYSFEPNTAMWALLFVLPLEAAVRYEMVGACGSIAAVAVSEVSREALRYPVTWGSPATLAGLSFRLGILTLIGLLAGLTIRSLERERREAELSVRQLADLAAEKEHLALHDSLTGLPNRELFRARVAEAVGEGAGAGTRVAVLLMDLDRFKEINDTLGHHNGDRVLKVLADRLAGSLGTSATVARLGGDEFGILFPGMNDASSAVAAARDVLELLEEPVDLDGLALHIEGSIGVSVYPEHGEDADQLIQRADVALYLTKGSQDGVELYSATRDRYRPSRLALMGELRRGLEGGELVLFYQPQFDLSAGRVTGVEALVRWQHPTRGLVLPDEFIPLAERTGLIRPLTLRVLGLALQQWSEWRREGRTLQVSVNLSARNLHDPQLADEVSRLMWTWKVPPGQLTLEITESAVMGDPLRALALLPKLRAMGIRLSIDDFGTGYSSLAYLKQMPVSQVKVDRSFVTHMDQDPTDAAIVRGTIELAHNLGLEVVAEGVETTQGCQALMALGCDLAQGWWLSPALPAAELAGWLDRRHERPGLGARGRSS
jgi:diguanylate cyclase (GGDEF)-like protein